MRTRFIGPKSHPGWRGALPHYEIDCERHGLVYDYPHGFAQRLGCPICAAVRLHYVGREEFRIAVPEVHHVNFGEGQAVER